MKILLIRPPREKQAITLGEFMFCEPIGLEIVAGVLKDSHDVRIFDMMIEPQGLLAECEQFAPEVVGITSLCIDVHAVKAIAEQVKAFNPRIITIAGGTQALLNPQAFYLEAIDYVMEFTTRANLQQLFSGMETDRQSLPLIDGVHSRAQEYQTTHVKGRNEMLRPDRQSTARYRNHYSYLGFKPCAIMQTSQGCSKHCDFCLRWRIEGGKECAVNLANVMEQIEEISEPSIMIFDNDFLHDRELLEAFCDELNKRNIQKNFICYASVHSIISHPETIRRFARHGLRAVLVGYETFNEQEMAEYKKKTTVDDNYRASRLLKEIGVDCWASFILHPDWDTKDFKRFRRIIMRLKPEITTFSPLTPFHTLPMYERFRDRLLYQVSDYNAWSFSKVTIRPGKLSLRQYYLEVLRTIFFINLRMNSSHYLLRRFGFPTLFRIGKGSIRVLFQYLRLIRQA